MNIANEPMRANALSDVVALLFAGLTLAGTPALVAPAAAQGWSVEARPRISIGTADGEEAYQFHRVRDVLLLNDGRMVVANDGVPDVRIFDPAGRHLRTIGRKGSGPGEFQDVSGVHLVGRDSLYIFDNSLSRLSVFRTTGEFLTSIRVHATGDEVRPIRMYRLAGVLANRNLVMVAQAFPADMKPKATLHFDSLPTLLFRRDGVLIGEIGEPVGMDMYAMPRQSGDVKFGRISSAYVDSHFAYITDGGKLQVRVYDPSADCSER